MTDQAPACYRIRFGSYMRERVLTHDEREAIAVRAAERGRSFSSEPLCDFCAERGFELRPAVHHLLGYAACRGCYSFIQAGAARLNARGLQTTMNHETKETSK